MSVRPTYSVFCNINGNYCYGWIAESSSKKSAVAVAKKNGWLRKRNPSIAIWGTGSLMDVCPACKGTYAHIVALKKKQEQSSE